MCCFLSLSKLNLFYLSQKKFRSEVMVKVLKVTGKKPFPDCLRLFPIFIYCLWRIIVLVDLCINHTYFLKTENKNFI